MSSPENVHNVFFGFSNYSTLVNKGLEAHRAMDNGKSLSSKSVHSSSLKTYRFLLMQFPVMLWPLPTQTTQFISIQNRTTLPSWHLPAILFM
jgi:hypothetical protein